MKLELKPTKIIQNSTSCLSTWCANINIPIAFKITDVTRYTTKAEKAITDYTETFAQFFSQDLAPEANLQCTASTLFLKTVKNC